MRSFFYKKGPAGGSVLCDKTILLQVDRKEIAFLRFIFEAYEGIAVLSTVDQRNGIVVLHVPPGCEEAVEGVIDDLSGQIRIETGYLDDSGTFGSVL